MNLNVVPEYNFLNSNKNIIIRETGISRILENLPFNINSLADHRKESDMSMNVMPRISGLNRAIDDLETVVSLLRSGSSINNKLPKLVDSIRDLAVLRIASENLISSEDILWNQVSDSMSKNISIVK